MKIQVNFVINPKGQVAVDVVGAKGKMCETEILAQLEALLGAATYTKRKPEYELDLEVVEVLRDQEVKL